MSIPEEGSYQTYFMPAGIFTGNGKADLFPCNFLFAC
jgi:hypothetical protein